MDSHNQTGGPQDGPRSAFPETKQPAREAAPRHWSERPTIQLGVNLIMIVLVLTAAFLLWQRVANGQAASLLPGGLGQQEQATPDGQAPTAQPTPIKKIPAAEQGAGEPVALAPLITPATHDSITRLVESDTTIPNRPRVDVITYTVQTGDNLFGIAEQFGIKPETLLWGNFETLKDNPHLLSPDQVLNILPTNGTYYQWKDGDTIGGVAEQFKADYKEILDYPGNRFDLAALTSDNPQIEPGTWVIIPGGSRPIKDWGPPAITRSNPASARYYGEGHCGSVYEGAYGTGTFVWPTVNRSISGYHYSAIHPAIDIGGATGDAVVAADSGVIVYAGWSNYGYGYLIVIDHGNGWQTAYAHMSAVAVRCGQSVFQGGYIGALGSTGNSTGPHLHLEFVYNGAKPNPLDFLP